MQDQMIAGANRQEVDQKINRDLLGNVLHAPTRYWVLVSFLALVVCMAGGVIGYMINQGLGVAGYNRPVMWAFYITNFVFWVGISHAGVMLSAILRLAQAEWRRPATRAAEVVTVFSLMTAVMMPVLHSGRPWRTVYWAFPYDFARGIWPNVRSPLVWDPAAITTYLTSSILFVYVALVPDFAVVRDRSTGIRKAIYGVLAMGWRGYPFQWRLQIVAGFLLSALILPVFVSVHSIVATDFAVAQSVEAWHSTVFPPYFVIGAVWSGVSAVVTVLILFRYLFHWEDYITRDTIDSLGRLLLVVGVAWFYFLAMEVLFGMYTLDGPELNLRGMQMMEPPYSYLYLTFMFTGFIFPAPMLLFKKVRRSFGWMVVVTISVNIGMWLERFLIIIPGLARKTPLTFNWSTYHPSIIEILIVVGTFAFVSMMVLLFAKVAPLVPLYDIKEGQVMRDFIQIGKVRVPATRREE